MGGLQVGIGPVQRVAISIALEAIHFGAVVLARGERIDSTFVDVVAEMHYEIEILAREVAVGGVQAVLPVLAGYEREPQLVDRRIASGQRTRAAHGAFVFADGELVEVPPVGIESVDFDVNGMGKGCGGHCHTLGDDSAHPFVFRDGPADANGNARRPVPEQVGEETRPQYDTVRRRIAGADAEWKRVVPQPRRRERASRCGE